MEKKVISNDEIIPPIINDRVLPTNNNLKKSVIHNLEKNEISPRKKLIQEKLKLKKLQIKKDNLEILKYKNEKTNYQFNPTHQSVNSANIENINENNNNNPYKIFIKKIKPTVKLKVNNLKEELILKSPKINSKKFNLHTENITEIQKNIKNINPILWLYREKKKEGKGNLDKIEDLITSLTITTKPNSSDEKFSTKLIPIQFPLPNIISFNTEIKNNLNKKPNEEFDDEYMIQNLYSHKNWKKGEIIHNGENSIIYKAFNISIGNIFIVKEYKINDNSINKKNFFQEVKILKLLKHSNIVNFLGGEVFKNKHYIYLDYISGDNIKNFISKFGGIKENMIKKYIKQIISVFEFIYSQGYFYGNLSLNHILIDSDGLIKITDFSKIKNQRNFQKNNFFNLTSNCDIQSIGKTFKEIIYECEKSYNEVSYSDNLKEYLDFISNDKNLITFHALKNHPYLK